MPTSKSPLRQRSSRLRQSPKHSMTKSTPRNTRASPVRQSTNTTTSLTCKRIKRRLVSKNAVITDKKRKVINQLVLKLTPGSRSYYSNFTDPRLSMSCDSLEHLAAGTSSNANSLFKIIGNGKRTMNEEMRDIKLTINSIILKRMASNATKQLLPPKQSNCRDTQHQKSNGKFSSDRAWDRITKQAHSQNTRQDMNVRYTIQKKKEPPVIERKNNTQERKRNNIYNNFRVHKQPENIKEKGMGKQCREEDKHGTMYKNDQNMTQCRMIRYKDICNKKQFGCPTVLEKRKSSVDGFDLTSPNTQHQVQRSLHQRSVEPIRCNIKPAKNVFSQSIPNSAISQSRPNSVSWVTPKPAEKERPLIYGKKREINNQMMFKSPTHPSIKGNCHSNCNAHLSGNTCDLGYPTPPRPNKSKCCTKKSNLRRSHSEDMRGLISVDHYDATKRKKREVMKQPNNFTCGLNQSLPNTKNNNLFSPSAMCHSEQPLKDIQSKSPSRSIRTPPVKPRSVSPQKTSCSSAKRINSFTSSKTNEIIHQLAAVLTPEFNKTRQFCSNDTPNGAMKTDVACISPNRSRSNNLPNFIGLKPDGNDKARCDNDMEVKETSNTVNSFSQPIINSRSRVQFSPTDIINYYQSHSNTRSKSPRCLKRTPPSKPRSLSKPSISKLPPESNKTTICRTNSHFYGSEGWYTHNKSHTSNNLLSSLGDFKPDATHVKAGCRDQSIDNRNALSPVENCDQHSQMVSKLYSEPNETRQWPTSLAYGLVNGDTRHEHDSILPSCSINTSFHLGEKDPENCYYQAGCDNQMVIDHHNDTFDSLKQYLPSCQYNRHFSPTKMNYCQQSARTMLFKSPPHGSSTPPVRQKVKYDSKTTNLSSLENNENYCPLLSTSNLQSNDTLLRQSKSPVFKTMSANSRVHLSSSNTISSEKRTSYYNMSKQHSTEGHTKEKVSKTCRSSSLPPRHSQPCLHTTSSSEDETRKKTKSNTFGTCMSPKTLRTRFKRINKRTQSTSAITPSLRKNSSQLNLTSTNTLDQAVEYKPLTSQGSPPRSTDHTSQISSSTKEVLNNNPCLNGKASSFCDSLDYKNDTTNTNTVKSPSENKKQLTIKYKTCGDNLGLHKNTPASTDSEEIKQKSNSCGFLYTSKSTFIGSETCSGGKKNKVGDLATSSSSSWVSKISRCKTTSCRITANARTVSDTDIHSPSTGLKEWLEDKSKKFEEILTLVEDIHTLVSCKKHDEHSKQRKVRDYAITTDQKKIDKSPNHQCMRKEAYDSKTVSSSMDSGLGLFCASADVIQYDSQSYDSSTHFMSCSETDIIINQNKYLPDKMTGSFEKVLNVSNDIANGTGENNSNGVELIGKYTFFGNREKNTDDLEILTLEQKTSSWDADELTNKDNLYKHYSDSNITPVSSCFLISSETELKTMDRYSLPFKKRKIFDDLCNVPNDVSHMAENSNSKKSENDRQNTCSNVKEEKTNHEEKNTDDINIFTKEMEASSEGVLNSQKEDACTNKNCSNNTASPDSSTNASRNATTTRRSSQPSSKSPIRLGSRPSSRGYKNRSSSWSPAIKRTRSSSTRRSAEAEREHRMRCQARKRWETEVESDDTLETVQECKMTCEELEGDFPAKRDDIKIFKCSASGCASRPCIGLMADYSAQHAFECACRHPGPPEGYPCHCVWPALHPDTHPPPAPRCPEFYQDRRLFLPAAAVLLVAVLLMLYHGALALRAQLFKKKC